MVYPTGVHPLPKPRPGITVVRYDAIAGAAEVERLNQAIVAAKPEVSIAASYPLADGAKAQERLPAGHVLGKIVLRMH